MAGVCAKESPRTDGPNSGERQRITFTCSGAGGSNETYPLYQVISSNFSTGDRLVLEVAYEVVSASNVQSLIAQLAEVGPGAPQTAYDGTPSGTLSGFPAVAHKGVMRTPEITLQSGVTSLYVGIVPGFDTSGGSAGLDLYLSDAKVIKIL